MINPEIRYLCGSSPITIGYVTIWGKPYFRMRDIVLAVSGDIEYWPQTIIKDCGLTWRECQEIHYDIHDETFIARTAFPGYFVNKAGARKIIQHYGKQKSLNSAVEKLLCEIERPESAKDEIQDVIACQMKALIEKGDAESMKKIEKLAKAAIVLLEKE